MKTSSIPMGSKAAFLLAFALALAPAAKAQTRHYAYLTNNSNANSISVIDTDPSSATFDTVVGTISTTGSPFGVAVSPDNTRLYVTDFQPSTPATNTVEVFTLNFGATVTATPLATANLPAGADPTLLALTPDGSRAYVVDNGTFQVSVIDTNPGDGSKYNTDVADINVGFSPTGIAITPDGGRAYVTNTSDATISVIDTNPNEVSQYNQVLDTILDPIGNLPTGIAITPDGTRAYFTEFGTNAVEVIDTNPADRATTFDKVVASITVSGFGPWSVAITPDGTRAYVSSSVNADVSVLDVNPGDGAKYNTVIATISGLGSSPEGLAITGDGLHAYVADSFAAETSAIDTNPSSVTYNSIVVNVGVGQGPQDVAVTPVQTPQIFPFAAFSAKLGISGTGFGLNGSFTLGAGSPGIDLSTQPLTLSLDGFSMTIAPKSFQSVSVHHFLVFSGTINATYQNATVPISVSARIVNAGGGSYTIQISATGIDLTALTTPVDITLTIGPNTGSDSPSNGNPHQN